MLKLKSGIIALFLLMNGCAVVPSLDHLPATELIHVEREKVPFDLLGRNFRPLIQAVSDEAGAVVAKAAFFEESLFRLVLEQGTYTFDVKCLGGNRYSLSSFEKELLAGTDYIVYCMPISAKNILGLKAVNKVVPMISAKADYEKEKAESLAKIKSVESAQ